MQITYVGPSADGVEIAETGQHCPRGVPVEVEDAALAKSLLEQDVFERPSKPARKPGTTQGDDV